MGKVVNIDEMVQKEGMKKALDHLEEWAGKLQVELDMIKIMLKALR